MPIAIEVIVRTRPRLPPVRRSRWCESAKRVVDDGFAIRVVVCHRRLDFRVCRSLGWGDVDRFVIDEIRANCTQPLVHGVTFTANEERARCRERVGCELCNGFRQYGPIADAVLSAET